MKIQYRRTGGFANIPVNVEVDSANLPEEKASILHNLIAQLVPFSKEKVEAKPDMCSYDLLVEDDGQQYSLTANDETASDEMHELFDFLMQDGK